MQAYRNCPRYRYLHYHHGGLGFERLSLGLPLITGIAVHEALARLLQGEAPDVAIEAAWASYTEELTRGIAGVSVTPLFLTEQQAMLKGLLYAWAAVRLPILLRDYEPVLVEREMLWEMGQANGYTLLDMIRCDAVLRRRADGMLFYLEFKTTTKGDESWVRSWEHNSQLLINTAALEDLLGERIGGVLIEGLLKGSRRKCTLKTSRFHEEVIQDSPLCYAFRVRTDGGQWVYTTDWARGAEHFRVSDVFPEVRTWIAQLPRETVQALFVAVPPIHPSPEHLARHRRQMVFQEETVAFALDALKGASSPEVHRALLDCYFPQNDDHCFRYYGSPCDMEPICFTRAVAADPEGSGLYKTRVPHHDSEAVRASTAPDTGTLDTSRSALGIPPHG